MNSKQILGIIEQDTKYKDYYIKVGRCYFLAKKSLTIGAVYKTRNKDKAVKRHTKRELREIAKIFKITLVSKL